jgi:aspartate oxidase
LAPEALRGVGGILVNRDGKRFVNELGLRDHVTQQIFEHCLPLHNAPGAPIVAYLLMNELAVRKFSEGAIKFYKCM